MSVSQELWDTFRKLAALEARTEDVMRSLERVGDKVDSLIERISRVEIQYQSLRENVRSEILRISRRRSPFSSLPSATLPRRGPRCPAFQASVRGTRGLPKPGISIPGGEATSAHRRLQSFLKLSRSWSF